MRDQEDTAAGPTSGVVPALRRPTWSLMAPFVVVSAVGLVTTLLPPYPTFRPVATGLAVVLLALSGAAFAVSLRRPERTWLDPTAAYLLFPCVAFARHAEGGGASGLSALVLIPLLWLALTGTRRELHVATGLAALTFLAPLMLTTSGYPPSEWRRAATWAAIALLLAPLVQRLVARLARETQAARTMSRELDMTNRALLGANRRILRLFEDAPHGVAVIDRQGRITSVNGALREIAGADAGVLEGQPFAALGPLGDPDMQAHIQQLFSSESQIAQGTAVVLDQQGNTVPVSLSSRLLQQEDGTEDLGLVHVVDVSEQRRYEQRLAHLADHDELTGVANRRLFEQMLDRHLASPGEAPSGAVLLLDLDNFKQVNDTLGHRAGDELLVEVAALLSASVRSTDLVARLGGDEFALLITNGGQRDAETVAHKIVTRLRAHTAAHDGVRRRVTTSVGVVTFKAASEHPVDILALADMTMYDAKEAGRDRYTVLAEDSHRAPRIGARLQWQGRIENALRRDDFVLHFQPIMDLATDRVSSAEVLIRLADSDELISPSVFLPVADRSGLAPAVDAWVVRHAAAELTRLTQWSPGFQLAVNLSGHSIGAALVEEAVTAVLRDQGTPAQSLILEITETAAVSDVDQARAFAERMAALGCLFALDDFGAGFGSFYYLKHLLFDFIKIDGEFVAAAHRSPVDRRIVRSMVTLARSLGKRTVAEFVTSPEVLAVVRTEQVDRAQGFLIGKPVPADDFIATHLADGHRSTLVAGRV